MKRIRKPAVAGMFYPADAGELERTVRGSSRRCNRQHQAGNRRRHHRAACRVRLFRRDRGAAYAQVRGTDAQRGGRRFAQPPGVLRRGLRVSGRRLRDTARRDPGRTGDARPACGSDARDPGVDEGARYRTRSGSAAAVPPVCVAAVRAAPARDRTPVARALFCARCSALGQICAGRTRCLLRARTSRISRPPMLHNGSMMSSRRTSQRSIPRG